MYFISIFQKKSSVKNLFYDKKFQLECLVKRHSRYMLKIIIFSNQVNHNKNCAKKSVPESLAQLDSLCFPRTQQQV